MRLIDNLILNGFSVLLLTILLAYSLQSSAERALRQRLYIRTLLCTIALLILDYFSRFDGHLGTVYPLINQVCNFLLFLLNPVLPSIWLAYADILIYHDERRVKKLFLPLLALNALNAVIVVISQFTGWYYYIDANNIYHRGPLFILSMALMAILLIIAFSMCVQNRDKIHRRQLFSILFFPIPPALGTIAQVCVYGLAFALNAMTLSLLVVLLHMTDDAIYTDYLTGIGNRKKAESVLKESIKRSSKRRTFSLVMLDVDKFKEINDTYGHEMGDKALRAFAALLKKCTRTKDYVARFGGDEFCLILEIYDIANLEIVIRRLNHYVDLLNTSNEFPFKLSLATGYAVYDYNTGLSMEDFVNQVDMMMYENKRKKAIDVTESIYADKNQSKKR